MSLNYNKQLAHALAFVLLCVGFLLISGDASADALGDRGVDGNTITSLKDTDISSGGDAASAVEVLDQALEDLVAQQSQIGATIRRFDFTITNLEGMILQTENNKNSLTALDEAKEIMSTYANASVKEEQIIYNGALLKFEKLATLYNSLFI